MNEDSLWEWLRDVVLPDGDYSRIESAHTAPGFPDVDYCLDVECSGQIELKYSKLLDIPFPGKPGLRKSQLKWIRNRVARKGMVWIIAEAPPDIYVIHGKAAEEFNGATRETLAKISDGILSRGDTLGSHFKLRDLLYTWKYDND